MIGHMRATETILYEGDEPPRVMFETADGHRYTPEQWKMMQFLNRVEKKLDRIEQMLARASITQVSDGNR